MSAGRVSALGLFPVKGLRGLSPDSMAIERCGPVGDRRWLVADPDGRFITQRELAALARIDAIPTADGLLLRMDGAGHAVTVPGAGAPIDTVTVWRDRVRARRADDASARWLSDRLGRACALWFMHDTTARPVDPDAGKPADRVSFADGFPLLAVNGASLDALNASLGADAVPMNRFRANIVVEGLPAWSENNWRAVRIGGMRFRAPKSCTRCVVVTRDQHSGMAPKPGEPLRTLGRLNRLPDGIVFGMNLVPEGEGRISLGDPVRIEPAG